MKNDRSESGAAGVEFAIIVPLIALLCCALLDYGRAVNLGTELRNAARAGAQYAVMHNSDTNGIAWAAQNATKETINSTDVSVVSTSDPAKANATLPYYCTCTDGNPTAANLIPCNGAGSTCATGTKKWFVAVTVSQTYTPLLPYPGLPSSVPVSGLAIVQLQ